MDRIAVFVPAECERVRLAEKGGRRLLGELDGLAVIQRRQAEKRRDLLEGKQRRQVVQVQVGCVLPAHDQSGLACAHDHVLAQVFERLRDAVEKTQRPEALRGCGEGGHGVFAFHQALCARGVQNGGGIFVRAGKDKDICNEVWRGIKFFDQIVIAIEHVLAVIIAPPAGSFVLPLAQDAHRLPQRFAQCGASLHGIEVDTVERCLAERLHHHTHIVQAAVLIHLPVTDHIIAAALTVFGREQSLRFCQGAAHREYRLGKAALCQITAQGCRRYIRLPGIVRRLLPSERIKLPQGRGLDERRHVAQRVIAPANEQEDLQPLPRTIQRRLFRLRVQVEQMKGQTRYDPLPVELTQKGDVLLYDAIDTAALQRGVFVQRQIR